MEMTGHREVVSQWLTIRQAWISPWWRFSEYETRHGHILPAKGAVLETYDPWQAYLESRSTRDAVPPYQSLVTLLPWILFVPGGEGLTLQADSKKQIVDWCRSFGLLGLLPHEATSVTLAPVCMVGESIPTEYEDPDLVSERPPTLSFHQRTYSRMGARWTTANWGEEHEEPSLAPAMGELRRRGLLYEEDFKKLHGTEFLGVPSAEMSRLPLPPGHPYGVLPEGVVRHELEHGCYRPLEPFSALWGDFLPSLSDEVKEAFQYPEPLSPEFWGLYAEPVQKFVDTAILFRRILGWLYLLWGPDEERYKHSPEYLIELFGGPEFGGAPFDPLLALSFMVAGVSPVPSRDEHGDFHVTSRFPSLVAALATMIIKDLEDGRRPRLCEECQTPFLTSGYQTRYCSVRCRNTGGKRKYRLKKRAERMKQEEAAMARLTAGPEELLAMLVKAERGTDKTQVFDASLPVSGEVVVNHPGLPKDGIRLPDWSVLDDLKRAQMISPKGWDQWTRNFSVSAKGYEYYDTYLANDGAQ